MHNVINLLLILISGLFIIIGTIIILLTKNHHKIIRLTQGLVFGTILSLIIGDLLPKAISIFRSRYELIMLILVIIAFIGIGILLIKIFDYFIPKHEGTKIKDEQLHLGILMGISIALYNIMEGIFLYRTFDTSIKSGLLLTLVIGLCIIPMGMIMASSFYRLKNEKKKFYFIASLMALSPLIGGIITLLFNDKISDLNIGMLLCIASGAFLYTIFKEIFPQLKKSSNKAYSILGIGLGVLIFIITIFI